MRVGPTSTVSDIQYLQEHRVQAFVQTTGRGASRPLLTQPSLLAAGAARGNKGWQPSSRSWQPCIPTTTCITGAPCRHSACTVCTASTA